MMKNKRTLHKLIQFICVISLALNINEIQLIKKNKELEVAAYIDKITGLPGRRSCEEKILVPMDSKKSPHCVIIFDINNLKQVNDQLGHHEGDRLIKAFADILNNFRSKDVFVGRYGGDEFIIIVADVFDAITSKRNYRKALCYRDALKEIRKETPLLLDENVVIILEKIIGGHTRFNQNYQGQINKGIEPCHCSCG